MLELPQEEGRGAQGYELPRRQGTEGVPHMGRGTVGTVGVGGGVEIVSVPRFWLDYLREWTPKAGTSEKGNVSCRIPTLRKTVHVTGCNFKKQFFPHFFGTRNSDRNEGA